MGKTKRPTESDILQCYDEIVNHVSSGGKFRPFYDDKATTTFDKLLQLILLFKVSNFKINCNKICNDFEHYVNISKGAIKIGGLGGVGEKVLILYTYFLCSINKNQEDRNDFTIINILDRIIKESKLKQTTLQKENRANEEAARNILIRVLFFQATYRNYKISDQLKQIFFDNANSIVTDSSLKNKIWGLSSEKDYNILLNEIQEKYSATKLRQNR